MEIDFKILTPEKFEYLIKDIFIEFQNQYHKGKNKEFPILNIESPGRGQDKGIDLKIITRIFDGICYFERLWIVQCKHFAKSNKSVSESDLDKSCRFKNVVDKTNADGYLLICSTRPSSSLKETFDDLTKINDKIKYIVWGENEVKNLIIKMPTIIKKYFLKYHYYIENLKKIYPKKVLKNNCSKKLHSLNNSIKQFE